MQSAMYFCLEIEWKIEFEIHNVLEQFMCNEHREDAH